MEPPLLQTLLQTLLGTLQSELSVQGLNAALQVRITGALDMDSFSSMHTYPDQTVRHTIRPQCAHSALGMLIIPNYLGCIAIHSDKLLIIQPWEPPVCRTLLHIEELVIKPWMWINNQCYFMCIILIKPSSLLFSPQAVSWPFWTTAVEIFGELMHFGKHLSMYLITSSPSSSSVTLDFSSSPHFIPRAWFPRW